ncbi:MAG: glycoside hydrolase family 3 N-terminal domain-containing protein [Bacteroidales bacterium]|nr:glycoside hydrolase family 3 N-terminal domain-containing protein [Bacteroidales bacterium]
MRKDLICLVFLNISLLLINGMPLKAQSRVELKDMVAQMVLVGFRGTVLSPDSPIIKDIESQKIGGVILYDYDVPSASRPRNIVSANQLKNLVSDLQSHAEIPLFIAIDQEGGKVNRLKTRYGFPRSVEAAYLGELNNGDSTRYYASLTAETLKKSGINVNFAPVLDINVNPECPVIGKLGRSFSYCPDVVINQAAIFYEEQKAKNILTVNKHFPGHGSSRTDSHKGFTDITATWSSLELDPYTTLINQHQCEAIMTAHVYNANLDSIWPATLSYAVNTELLRGKLGFEGLIFSDDMMMGAIADIYSLKVAIKQSIMAGVDVLVFSNNIKTYDDKIASSAIQCILQLIHEGEIPESRIRESWQRISESKKMFNLHE